MEDRLIIVLYVGVAGIRSEDIKEYLKKITNKIGPTQFEGELVVIPVQSYDTRLECINPKYITEAELIQEHTELMDKLNQELKIQLELLKEENNG